MSRHDFNINQLQLMLSIINAASERGLFKAQELSTVGALNDHIVAVAQAIASAPQVEEATNA